MRQIQLYCSKTAQETAWPSTPRMPASAEWRAYTLGWYQGRTRKVSGLLTSPSGNNVTSVALSVENPNSHAWTRVMRSSLFTGFQLKTSSESGILAPPRDSEVPSFPYRSASRKSQLKHQVQIRSRVSQHNAEMSRFQSFHT